MMKRVLLVMIAVFTLALGATTNTAEARQDVYVTSTENAGDVYLDRDSVHVIEYKKRKDSKFPEFVCTIYATYYCTKYDFPSNEEFDVTINLERKLCLVNMYVLGVDKDAVLYRDSFFMVDDGNLYYKKLFLAAWDEYYGKYYPFDITDDLK